MREAWAGLNGPIDRAVEPIIDRNAQTFEIRDDADRTLIQHAALLLCQSVPDRIHGVPKSICRTAIDVLKGQHEAFQLHVDPESRRHGQACPQEMRVFSSEVSYRASGILIDGSTNACTAGAFGSTRTSSG